MTTSTTNANDYSRRFWQDRTLPMAPCPRCGRPSSSDGQCPCNQCWEADIAARFASCDTRTHFLCNSCWKPFPLADRREWWTMGPPSFEDCPGDPDCEPLCPACFEEVNTRAQRIEEALSRGELVTMACNRTDEPDSNPFEDE